MSLFTLDPHVERYLIADDGEVIIDEVHKHWAAIVGPVLQVVLAFVIAMLMFWFPAQAAWLPLAVALLIAGRAFWRILTVRMDRFVITNMRVFRVHGVFAQNIATMPLTRILDITVHKPFVGRILGYGHFVFESAAQAQGLREIRFVGAPNERGATIQKVIQRSGLRGPVRQSARSDAGDAETQPFPPNWG
ncbi:PH domain-containing protein [Agromyces larvae]|uniref:PH domain-containing protein n=1 Tax=Agromyces larvae TaxID=2929802 RepID=A0ABY4C4Z3_9MICO|nr:PH domain-containing protein [Agromyces larvae]UOE43810.1 PH domain-containing protein [Agromyces larvae]